MFQFQPNLELFDPLIRIGQIFGIPFVFFDIDSMGFVFEMRSEIRRFGENRMVTQTNETEPFLVHGNRIDILVLFGLGVLFGSIRGSVTFSKKIIQKSNLIRDGRIEQNRH
jgi:hypothetical protein